MPPPSSHPILGRSRRSKSVQRRTTGKNSSNCNKISKHRTHQVKHQEENEEETHKVISEEEYAEETREVTHQEQNAEETHKVISEEEYAEETHIMISKTEETH